MEHRAAPSGGRACAAWHNGGRGPRSPRKYRQFAATRGDLCFAAGSHKVVAELIKHWSALTLGRGARSGHGCLAAPSLCSPPVVLLSREEPPADGLPLEDVRSQVANWHDRAGEDVKRRRLLVGPNRRPRSAEERRTHLHRRLYLMRKSPTLPYDIQAFGSAERFGNRQWGSTCEMIWPQKISRIQADCRFDILRGVITGRRDVGRSCPLQTISGRR